MAVPAIPAELPNAVLFAPVVLEPNAWYPIAVLFDEVVEPRNDWNPSEVLLPPVVFVNNVS